IHNQHANYRIYTVQQINSNCRTNRSLVTGSLLAGRRRRALKSVPVTCPQLDLPLRLSPCHRPPPSDLRPQTSHLPSPTSYLRPPLTSALRPPSSTPLHPPPSDLRPPPSDPRPPLSHLPTPLSYLRPPP